jgi:hypothetical protein
MGDRPNTRLGGLAARVHDELDDSTVEEHHGRTSFAENKGDRRIHWLELTGLLGAPTQAGGRREAETDTARKPACKTRTPDIECHIFAETPEHLERLFENAVAAIYKVTRFTSGRYRIPTQEDVSLAGLTNNTEWLILTFSVSWPVLEEIQPLRTVVSTLQSSGVIQADGTVNPQ